MRLVISITLAFLSLIVVPCVAKFFVHDTNSWAKVLLFIMQIPMLWPIVREVSDEEWVVDFLNPNTDPLFPSGFEFYEWSKKWAMLFACIVLIDLGYIWIGFWMVMIVLIVITAVSVTLYKMGETGSRLSGER